MKSPVKIFVLSVFGFVLLSACANPFKKAESVQPPEEDAKRVYTCEDLKNEDSRQNCVQEMGDMALYELNDEIINSFDLKRCVELPQERAEECVNQIKESGVNGPLASDQILAFREALKPLYKISEDGTSEEEYYDNTKCSTLTAEGLKEYCEKQINMYIDEQKIGVIIEGGDVTKCDELKDESMKKSCKMELGVAIEEPENTEPEMAEEPVEPVDEEVAQ